MKSTLIKIIFIIVAVATVGLLAYIFVSPEVDGASMHEATINNVRTMARLQSMEIYDEVPVKGSIGSRHLVGRLRVRGNVGFDIDKLNADLSADTVRLYLPAEVIDVYESTDPVLTSCLTPGTMRCSVKATSPPPRKIQSRPR